MSIAFLFRPSNYLFKLLFGYILLVTLATPSLAENTILISPTENVLSTWNLAADKLVTLGDNTIIEATGGVELQRGQDILKADFARYYVDTNWIYLEGNVFVRMGRDDLRATSAEFDLKAKTGWLTDGYVFMEGPHIYFSGGKIIKHFGDRYTFNQAKVTICDGPEPAWSMSAEQAVVEIDGYAQLFHTSFDIKNTGVMYSPFMILPAKTTRQSGLLPPDFGISSKKGIFYTQPYFWVLDESRDITFYAGMMEKIGPAVGVEYRAHEFTNQKTWLAFTAIGDKNRVRFPSQSNVYENSSEVRTNQDRYWLRGMFDGYVGASTWQYRGNLDYVSDQDFLREFKQGPMGFTRSRNSMFRMFGRDIQEDDQNRINAALLSNDWNQFGFVASMRYEQDPSLGHGNRPRHKDELVQQLPRLDFFMYKSRPLPELPLEMEANVQTAYMYRATGTTGWRTEIYPKVSLPLDFGYASLTPTVGLRHTMYNTSRRDYTSPRSMYNPSPQTPRQTGENRTLVDFKLEGYTSLSNVYNLKAGETLKPSLETVGSFSRTAFRHEIQPRFSYTHTPKVDQERNPFYISDDRLLANNELTYSMTNILTQKGFRVITTGDEDTKTAVLAPEYQDILRWRLEHGYDFAEASRTNYLSEYARRPIKDIMSDLDLYPLSWLGYNAKTFISPYDGKITRNDHNIFFSYFPNVNWATGLSFRDKYYDYRRKFQYEDWRDVHLTSSLNLLRNFLSIQVTPEWSVAIEDYRNLREGNRFGRAYEQSVEVRYSAQCYRFVGRYRFDGYDKSFTVMVELPGIFE